MSTVIVPGVSYVLPAGATLTTLNEDALLLQEDSAGAANDVTIAGTISATMALGYAGATTLTGIGFDYDLPATNTLYITSSGRLTVETQGPNQVPTGIASGAYSGRVVNDGTIEVDSQYNGVGVQLGAGALDRGGGLINHGAITVTGLALVTGVSAPRGADLENTGSIIATGHSAVGVDLRWLSGAPHGGSSLINSGLIQATQSGGGVETAVRIWTPLSGAVINSGTIQGAVALDISWTSASPQPTGVVNNSGHILGQVKLDGPAFDFINTGTVEGTVNLGTQDDIYDGGGGQVTGLVQGMGGNDQLTGGTGFDYLQGNAGNDTVAGGGGNDWVVGGMDQDRLDGGTGDDVVYGNKGADTALGGAGADQVRGGQGDDVIEGGEGNDWLSGDLGADTISGGTGADIFHTWGDAGIDRVTDFSAAEGDRVQLDPGTTYSVAQVGADTVITMTGGAVMTLVGVTLASLPPGWIFTA
jgi:Ca2+-binding RTX toxin-like protein